MDFNKIAEKNCILKATVGSKLYGTNSENSDNDYVGIFMPDENMVYGLYKCEQVEIKTNASSSGVKNNAGDTDYTCYEFRKFIHLCQKATPNILEILFVPDQLKLMVGNFGYFEWIVKHRNMFITKRIFDTFMEYAIAQERLLKTKTIRYKALLEMYAYLQDVYPADVENPLGIDRQKKLIEIYPDFRNKKGDIKQFNETMPFKYVFENIKREVEGYGYRKENILKHNFEIKYASHMARLLMEGIELTETGMISYPLANAEVIKAIKYGEVNESDFYGIVETLKKRFREVESKSNLPAHPDMDDVNKFQIEMIKDFLGE